MDNAWIAALKPGDKVIATDNTISHVVIVDRVTKTLVITHDGRRYSRHDGCETGRSIWVHSSIEQATPERYSAVSADLARRRKRAQIKQAVRFIEDKRLTDEALQSIYDACAPLRAFATEKTAS